MVFIQRLLTCAWIFATAPACSDNSSNTLGQGGTFTSGGSTGGAGHSQAGNGGNGGSSQSEPDAAELSIFDAWRGLRDSIRTSPDHFVAQADVAVKSGDPQKILDFVSKNIRNVPLNATSFNGAVTGMRWGTRAALRGGAGTLREKTELLASLYNKAGFATRVMAVAVDSGATLGPQLFAPLPRPTFAPVIDDASFARWQAALGIDPASTPTPVPSLDFTQAQTLADSITPLLPAGAASPKAFDWTSLYQMPLVEVTVNGSPIWANPAIAGTKLGDSLSTSVPVVADPPAAPPTVQVKLEGVTAAHRTKRQLLVAGSYSLSDLLGRQLVASFVPALPPETMFSAKIGSEDGFYPVLGVRGVDLTTDQTMALVQSGALINTSGDIVTQTSTGSITIDGQPLGAVINQPDAVARVSSVQVMQVNATGFPRVQVRARALDAAGNEVAGVPAAAISVVEAGSARPLVVLQNAATPPRVLFVLDTSSSMPAEFLGAQAASVVQNMATQLLALDARSEFAVAAVMAGLTGMSAWLSDPVALATAASQESGYASDLWGALDAATAVGASAVVLITDGEADTTPTDAQLTRIAAGPPAVLLKVGTGTDNSLDRMAAITSGARFEVADSSAAVTAVSSTLQAIEQAPLVLEYQAPADGTAQRSLILTVGQAPDASGTYAVPANTVQVPPPAWAGFYLTIDDGTEQVTRVLGGALYADDYTAIPQSILDQTRYALYGQHAVSFEAGAPTTAEWLDDILSSKIALEPLWNAAHTGSNSDILTALKQGVPYIPQELPLLQAPLPAETDGTMTFETGPRAVLLSAYPDPTLGQVRHADILPFTHFATVDGTAPADNFSRTLARSSLLAVAEKQLYTESTAALLQGQALVAVVPFAIVGNLFPALSADEQAAWTQRLEPYYDKILLVPADGSKPAFFVIDPSTGSMLAMLSDGSGGGLSASDQAMSQGALSASNWLGVAAEFAEGGFAFSAVVAIQQAILKVVLAEAAMVAEIGSDPVTGNPMNKAACGLACDLAKSGILGFLGLGGVSKGDAIGNATGGGSITCGCPQ